MAHVDIAANPVLQADADVYKIIARYVAGRKRRSNVAR